MGHRTLLWGAYFVLGTIWNMIVFTASGAVPWYQGLGAGLLLGGIITLIGEVILRPADIGLRRQNGVLAYISPSFIIRVFVSLVPGVIARLMVGEKRPVGLDDRFLDVTRDYNLVERRPKGPVLSVGDRVRLVDDPYMIMAAHVSPSDDNTYEVRPD